MRQLQLVGIYINLVDALVVRMEQETLQLVDLLDAETSEKEPSA